MLRPVYVRYWRIPHHRSSARRCPGRIARPGHGSAPCRRVTQRRVFAVAERRHRRLQRLSSRAARLWPRSLTGPQFEGNRTIARIRRLFRHQPGARAEEQCGYRRSRLRNTGSSRSRSPIEGDGYQALALGFSQKILEARFRYLVLQYDFSSEHGGRCLPRGNPHLSANGFGGSLSGEPVGACAAV